MTDKFQRAWQDSAADAAAPSIEEVRTGADRFYRIIRRRNFIEYAACALVVAFFGFGALSGAIRDSIAQAGALLVVAGTIFVAWQLHSRASAMTPPATDAALPILVHQRAQLVRQRDALAHVGLWYLLPFFPGLALMIFAPVLRHGLIAFGPGLAIAAAVNVVMFGGIWWLNRTGAWRLQKAIEEIDALTSDGS
jgi:hypothetical protein